MTFEIIFVQGVGLAVVLIVRHLLIVEREAGRQEGIAEMEDKVAELEARLRRASRNPPQPKAQTKRATRDVA